MLSKNTIKLCKLGAWIGTHIFFVSPGTIVFELKSYRYIYVKENSEWWYFFHRSATMSHILLRMGIMFYLGIFLAFVEISVSEKINIFLMTGQCLVSSAILTYIYLAGGKFTGMMNSMILFNKKQANLFKIPEFVKKDDIEGWLKLIQYASVAFGSLIPFMLMALALASFKTLTALFTFSEFIGVGTFIAKTLFVVLGSYFAYLEMWLYDVLVVVLISHCYFMEQWMKKYLEHFRNKERIPKRKEIGKIYRAYQVWNVLLQEFIDIGLTPVVISIFFAIVIGFAGIIFKVKDMEPLLAFTVFTAACLGIGMTKVAIDLANNITTKSLKVLANFKKVRSYAAFYRSCRGIRWKLGVMKIRPAVLAIIYEKLILSNVLDVLLLLAQL